MLLRSQSQLTDILSSVAPDIKSPTSPSKLRFPLLLKPNAGGFGRGQIRLANEEEVKSALSEGTAADSFAADGVALIQNYHSYTATYRVWTLGDKVQCAVRVEQGSPCMADVCALRRSRIVAWSPPAEVSDACIRVMKLCGAECGSIEFLTEVDYEKEKKKSESSAASTASASTTFDEVTLANAIFFDVNLVSTLPDPAKVINTDGVWPTPAPDFYAQLADYCVSRFISASASPSALLASEPSPTAAFALVSAISPTVAATATFSA